MTELDIVILGDGVAGCAAAIALSAAGAKVGLIRRDAPRARSLGEHLAPEAKPILQRLGVRHLLDNPAHINGPGILSRWASDHATPISYLGSPHGSGVNLNREVFDRDLRREATKAGALEYVCKRLISLHPEQDGIQVQTDTGSMRAKLFVDATGRAAAGARQLRATVQKHDQLAAFAVLLATDAQDKRLLIDSVETGWWYSIAVSDGVLAVWLTDADLLPTGPKEDVWWAAFDASPVKARLGAVTGGDMISAGANSQSLDQSSGPGWVAIGDAAAALDPISGAGITKALSDAEQIARAWVTGTAMPSTGERYQAYRRQLAEVYARCRRFPDAPFWQRRIG